MTWGDLGKGDLGADAGTPGIDAQLVWADATKWRDFRPLGERIPVVVELKAKGDAAAFSAEVNAAGGRIASCYSDPVRTFCTAELTPSHLAQVLAQAESHATIKRLELSRPLVPLRPRPVPERAADLEPTPSDARKTQGATLLGVIDSGCPFAHLDLRRRGAASTRIAQLWIQDDADERMASASGTRPGDFGYGVEFSRKSLDALMDKHRRGGTVDEAGCYEAAGMRGLHRQYQHGAAVLGLLAAPVPLASRVVLEQGSSPSWATMDDEAASADIVFVQLPADAVQDSTSAGLARHLLDGLNYILSCATDETKRIVVNISDGSSRGSHDGMSIIECAMRSLVQAEGDRGRVLEIVVAAGNSFDEERHAQFDGLADKQWHSVDLRVPPANEMPTQVVVRLPADAVQIRLTVPSLRNARCVIERGEAKAWFDGGQPVAAVVYPRPARPGDGVEALITFAPTTRSLPTDACASMGDWTISLRSPGGAADPVHLFVTRNQTNAGALCRGKQARFIDKSANADYDPRRHSRSLEDDPAAPRSPIRRRGSLNSLATSPQDQGIFVAGSRFVDDPLPALYSSTGPTIGGGRRYPDFIAPTEQSRGVPGIVSAGVLSGQRVRVQGTSFAAPQLARERANVDGKRDPRDVSLLRRERDRARPRFD